MTLQEEMERCPVFTLPPSFRKPDYVFLGSAQGSAEPYGRQIISLAFSITETLHDDH